MPDEIPGKRPARDEALTVYYEYYCPGCYTLLDVEVGEKGAAPMWDINVAV
jgi:acetone carboxylase gamma subunit